MVKNGSEEMVAPSPYRGPDGEIWHRELVDGRAIWRAEGGRILTALKEKAGGGWRYIKPAPGPAESEIGVRKQLRERIDAARGAAKTPAHLKLRKAARATFDALKALGQFHLTPEGSLYWFRHVDQTLYELPYRIQDAEVFVRILARLSGVNPEDSFMRQLYAHLRVKGPEKATPSRVHRLAHWDGEKLYVDSFDGGCYLLNRNERRHVANGTNGVLFLPEPGAEPYEPDFDADEDLFREKVCGLVHADETRGLAQEEAEEVLETWILASYFRSTQPTRPILCLWGEKGTTKTTTARAIGRTVLGPDFDVTALTRHKEDAFQARVTQAGLAVFDNADGKIAWLPDALATLATGGRVDRRKLFRTIELVSYPIQAWAVITSRDPQFGRDDVAERLLPIPTDRPKSFRREGEIQAELSRLRPQLWGSLLKRLQVCVGRLRENGMDLDSNFRMADFAAFLLAIQKDKAGQTHAQKLLKKLTALQDLFITETMADLWLQYLQEILEDGPMVAVTAGEVVKVIAARAKAENVPIKLSAQAVGSTLKNAGPNLRSIGLNVSHRILKGRRVYDLSLEGHEGKKTPSELVVHQIREATKDWASLGEVAEAVGESTERVVTWLVHLQEDGSEEERRGRWKAR